MTRRLALKLSDVKFARSDRRFLSGGEKAHTAAVRAYNRADRQEARRALRALRA